MRYKINPNIKPSFDQKENRAFLASSLLLFTLAWAYIWLRAAFVPFQSDEVATFFMYVQPGNFLPPYATIDANNHILNSSLSFISYRLFGSGPLALRLPNILAAPIYFYFVFKMSGKIKWAGAKYGFLILSVLTHFIIEFFGYSRGYGLSMAFLAGALSELINTTGSTKLKPVILTLIYISLATTANLNIIIISVSMHACLLMILPSNRKRYGMWVTAAGIAFVLIIGGIFTGYLVSFSLAIRNNAGFYYGAANGFLPVTVQSLAIMVSGGSGLYAKILTLSAFFITVLLSLISFIRNKFRFPAFHPYLIFPGLLIISWLSALMINRLLDVNYQEDRAAMHLIPLFYGMVFFGLERVYLKIKKYSLILLLPFLFIPAVTISKVTLKGSVYGNSQQVPSEFFTFIDSKTAKSEFPPVVSSYQARRQAWSYMNFRSGGRLNPIKPSSFPDRSADFLIHEIPLPDSLAGQFEPVTTDPFTKTMLCRNVAAPVFIDYQIFRIDSLINSTQLYQSLVKLDPISLTGKTLKIEAQMKIGSPASPLHATLVAEVFDQNRRSLVYEAIDLDQLQPAWDEDSGILRHVLQISEMPSEGRSVLLYLWNKEKVPVSVGDCRIIVKTGYPVR